MRVGISTYGFLYSASLEGALAEIARAGFKLVEIAPAEPHLQLGGLLRSLERLDLQCVSVNPPELNLISTVPELRDVALQQYRGAIRLAHELGAAAVVVIPGRRSQLIPMPDDAAFALCVDQVSRLAEDARRLDVQLAVETVPFGFAESAAEVVAIVRRVGDPCVRVALDVANIFGREDVKRAVAIAHEFLAIAHVSDTWRARWAHAQVGSGEVDFAEFITALHSIGFDGPAVYELVDGVDPIPRIAADLARLMQLGLEP